MRLLLIHAKTMKYRVTEEVKISAKDLVDEENKWFEFRNVLVSFTAIEASDETDPERIADKCVEELIQVNERIKAERILIYPYAHLFAPHLAKPKTAIQILNLIEEKLKERDMEVYRAPFGWYKEFNIHCLGHPLSESSRIISLEN
ncbi:MAG: threonyl-tRNA synthetase editing domain-containing protein [Candidatus Odinarchaeum yellowstonii]|jgi:threonyl-tRNA synthetase|uniref:Threonyl-tRNA synthetase editing domain-containing protein n=1 Tax=Odinarchaeota yellowstonii (strain LCB_4) TaxID=1841599 RepID=A0AAF0IBP7_ODILC|nr:MAG: threonyl-tRNA synthetase editing domain-containing protein [Candidatus Odinarchaeum yellowstonii]